jgi:hypothetical protein
MARERPHLFALNGGAVSPLALGRTDLARMRITAEEFHNCFPKVIGPLQFRPGLEHDGSTYNDLAGRHLPFIFSAEDTALVELTDLRIRPLVNGSPISRASVSTSITNGNFSSGTGWTLVDANVNSTVSGALVLIPDARGRTASASRSFNVSAGDQATEHAVRITVTRGIVRFKLGTSSGGQDILAETELGPGVHSLAFTPNAATVFIQLNSAAETQVVVDEIQIEAAGELSLTSPWSAAQLFELRYVQSGDVIFVVHKDHAPRRIERRGIRSWSLTIQQITNGPWKGKTANVTLDPNVRTGNGTMTASAAFFTPDMVGALFELTYEKTTASNRLGGDDTYSDWVRVAGYTTNASNTAVNERRVTMSRSGTWSGTLREYSADSPDGPWVEALSFSDNNGNYNRNVGSNGQITYYRMGFGPDAHSSGVAVVNLEVQGGGGTGVVRVTGYTSPTSVSIEVLSRLHSSDNCSNWREGLWSNQQGWPSAVEIFEGRLWFGSADKLVGSASDDFETFYEEEITDASPIVRSVAAGPVNRVQWLMGLARLLVGTSGAESSARSSSFDEPITPTNFSIKDASTIGSADIQAVKVDRSGVFVNRSGKRSHILSYSVEAQDYTASELSRYNPSILDSGVKVMAVQRQPDTRVWFVLEDGTAAVLTYEPAEDVLAWTTFETDGDIEDVCVLPNTEGDDVFLIVARNIDGTPKRYRERLAYEQNAEGGASCRMADSYKVVTLAASATVTGLSHLEGETVVVWQGTAPLLTDAGEPRTFQVSGGQITLPSAFTGDVMVGIPYEGRFKSTKLAYAAQTGTAVTQRKIVSRVSPLLYKAHMRAVLFGQDFTRMDPLPRFYRGADQGVNAFLEDYDSDGFTLPGSWSTDSRLCMKFRSPLPATVLGVVLEVESHERA